jgi:tripartite-type tricarboxylate transporter receptor subunit TctC
MISRRAWLAGAVASSAGLARRAHAQTYPSRVIKMIVPFAPGGPADTMARLAAQQLSTRLGQSVIIDNRGGAGGTIAAKAAAGAEPDGYTLMFGNTATFAVGPAVYANIGYDPIKNFAPIALFSTSTNLLVTDPRLPVQSVAELIAHAKANPGKLSYGTPGVGTPQHIAGELFCHLAGIKMEHIPYRGANLADVMSGVVQVGIQNAGASLPVVRDGRVRGIGITSLQRSANAPELPTFNESGFPGFEATSWFALMGPAGLPKPIVDKVRAESLKVLADPEMKQKFAALGLDTVGSTPEETRAAIAADIPKWAQVIKDANIKPAN